jgi:hypothetical protein
MDIGSLSDVAMAGKREYDFYTMLEARARDKAGVKYLDVLGNIPYTEIEETLRSVFSRHGIPENVKFSVDMELNRWEFD